MAGNLFIKIDYPNTTAPDDDGTRPYNGANPVWNNASIWLDGPPGQPTPSQTSTAVNHPTNLDVRVSNNGPADPTDAVHVQAWVLNPFTGAFDPAAAIATFTGFRQGISHGSDGGTTGDSTNVVLCQVGGAPWVPQQGDLDTQGGHLCVVANVYDDNEGGPIASAGDLHGPVGTDPHVGQRNITLLPAATQSTGFHVMPGAEAQEYALDIQPIHGFGVGDEWLLRSRGDISFVPGEDGRSRLVLVGRGGRPDVALSWSRKKIVGEISVKNIGPASLGELADLSDDFASGGGRPQNGFHPRQFVVRPGAPLSATVKVQRSDGAGSIQAFDIVQRDASGRIAGGLRVISIAPR